MIHSHEFMVGMAQMVPDQLSEAELLKIVGDCQWQAISKILATPSKDIVNDAGERLYASFVNVELDLKGRCFAAFSEGDRIFVKHRAHFYASRFAEGFFCFDNKELPEASLDRVSSLDGLRKVPHPWIYVTNALVTREASNLRLRTFAPATPVPQQASCREEPQGIAAQKSVQRTNQVDFPLDGSVVLAPRIPDPFVYPIVPESDLNGAGLLYFARYIAVLNYGERRFLQSRLPIPVSNRLVRFLSTERRRVFYFANADETDSIAVYVSARVSLGDGTEDKTRCTRLRLLFSTDLYRGSDGTLMAKSASSKMLTIPWGAKDAVHEMERLIAALGLQ